jgi:hypothetical protein
MNCVHVKAKKTRTRISEFPCGGNSGEIRLHVPIRRRAGKLALGTNPFSPAKPVKMIDHGGFTPSNPPGVHASSSFMRKSWHTRGKRTVCHNRIAAPAPIGVVKKPIRCAEARTRSPAPPVRRAAEAGNPPIFPFRHSRVTFESGRNHDV